MTFFGYVIYDFGVCSCCASRRRHLDLASSWPLGKIDGKISLRRGNMVSSKMCLRNVPLGLGRFWMWWWVVSVDLDWFVALRLHARPNSNP